MRMFCSQVTCFIQKKEEDAWNFCARCYYYLKHWNICDIFLLSKADAMHITSISLYTIDSASNRGSQTFVLFLSVRQRVHCAKRYLAIHWIKKKKLKDVFSNVKWCWKVMDPENVEKTIGVRWALVTLEISVSIKW